MRVLAIWSCVLLAAGCDPRPFDEIQRRHEVQASVFQARSGPAGFTVFLGTPGDGRALRAPRRAGRLRLVVDAPYQSFAGEGSIVHVAAFTTQMRPCPGAEVYVDGVLAGMSDRHGSFAFRRAPVEHEGAARRLDVLCDATRLAPRTRSSGPARLHGRMLYQSFARTSSFERPVLYVHTDRGIYHPGQTVHVRSLAWRLRGEYRPLVEQTVQITLQRLPLLETLGGGRLVTDAYGVGHLELPLGAHLAEGQYRLVARADTEEANASLEVRRFVPPAVEIQHTLGEFLTPAMTTLPFEVRLRMFDGAPFTQGRLAVSLHGAGFDRPIDTRAVTGMGPHACVVPADALQALRASPAVGGEAEVVLAVTDETGRTDTLRRALRLVDNPYRAVLETDRQEYAPGERVDVTLRISDVNGVSVRGRHVRLELPDRTLDGTTDADGVLHFRFGMAATAMTVRARLDDVVEPVATTELALGRVHPMQSTLAETRVRERGALHLTVRFPADVVPMESVVHADLVDSSGAIIASHLLPIAAGGREPVAEGRLEAPSWGSMLVTLFALAAPRDHQDAAHIGLVTDGQNVPVAAIDHLEVRLAGAPGSARPGEHLTLHAEVLRDGRPADAELGFQVVDRAVVSLRDPFEHPPRDVFYNPERKVLATTGAQTLTWPVVQRSWGEGRYDIGWPSTFGFHSGGDPAVDEEGPVGEDNVQDYSQFPGVVTTGIFAALGAPAGGMTGGANGIVSPFGGMAESGTDDRSDGRELLAPPRLVLRTGFHEVAAWQPALIAPDGRAELSVDLPDDITEQQVDVLASDRLGGVALARLTVPVRQDLYVRSDLPPVLVAGDETVVALSARNATAQPARVRLSLASPALEVASLDPPEVEVPAQGTGVVRFRVVARRPGAADYVTRGEAGTLIDEAQRTLRVLPSGVPVPTVQQGTLAADRPFVQTVTRASGAYASTVLSVRFPTTVALADALLALHDGPWPGVEPVASGLDAAAVLYRLGPRVLGARLHGELGTLLTSALVSLQAARNSDGGYGWYWQSASSVFATTWALESLERLQEAGLEAPPDALHLAARYLMGQLEQGPLLPATSMAVWEGDGPRVRAVLTAQAAAVLAAVPNPETIWGVDETLDHLQPRLEALLSAPDSDPLVLAHALRALVRIDARRHRPVDRTAAARRLLASRHESHWEPGWFDAFGGTIEATAVALEVLRATLPAEATAIEHDAAQYLLSTRHAWGAWHNSRATAWAIEALARMPQGRERAGAAVVLRVDGREVHRVPVDPADPWASTLALRHLEIDGWLSEGDHRVEVSYDGALEPAVVLTTERWESGVPANAVVMLQVPARVPTDRAFAVQVRVASPARTRSLGVRIPLPAYAEVDAGSLEEPDRLTATRHCEESAGAVECLLVEPSREALVTFRLRVRRPGRYAMGSPEVIDERGVRQAGAGAVIEVR